MDASSKCVHHEDRAHCVQRIATTKNNVKPENTERERERDERHERYGK